MALNIADLPFEMVMEIVEHVTDRRASSLVCKKFYDAVNKLDAPYFVLKLEEDDFVSCQC
jgi:hypothetical protein